MLTLSLLLVVASDLGNVLLEASSQSVTSTLGVTLCLQRCTTSVLARSQQAWLLK